MPTLKKEGARREISSAISLFPKEKGRSTPQTKDRHFWKVEAEKFINPEEKVQIAIDEFKKE